MRGVAKAQLQALAERENPEQTEFRKRRREKYHKGQRRDAARKEEEDMNQQAWGICKATPQVRRPWRGRYGACRSEGPGLPLRKHLQGKRSPAKPTGDLDLKGGEHLHTSPWVQDRQTWGWTDQTQLTCLTLEKQLD